MRPNATALLPHAAAIHANPPVSASAEHAPAPILRPQLNPGRARLAEALRAALSQHASRESSARTAGETADALLREALRHRASDIHLEPVFENEAMLRLRIDGQLSEPVYLDREDAQRLVRHFKALSGLEPTLTQRPQDGRRSYALDGADVDLRLATVPCFGGEKLVIRLLVRESLQRDIAHLGIAPDDLALLRRWLANAHGMLLVTGPTGSGKTTTLYSLLHELDPERSAIATVEDPVEYRVDGVAQTQVSVRAGTGFADAVRAMSRLDSDVLMVGEMREPASAKAAMEAAQRGKVLLSTLHCRDAVGVVRALRNWGFTDHDVAASLDLVIAQRLVRVLCPHCKREERPDDADRAFFSDLGIALPEKTFEPVGCPACDRSGYVARTGVFEIWSLDETDYRMLLDGAHELDIRRALQNRRAHRTLLDDGLAKARDGITSLEELKTLATFYAPRLPSAAGWRSESPRPSRNRRRAQKPTPSPELAAAS